MRESFVTRLTENANSYDLQGGGEPDVEEFAKKLAIVIYTGELTALPRVAAR